MKLKELNEKYVAVCNAWIIKFCKKQGLAFDGWVGLEVGGTASFIDQYFFTLSDIILDLKTRQPKGQILSWQDEGIDFNMLREKSEWINYKSYTMGLRYGGPKSKPAI